MNPKTTADQAFTKNIKDVEELIGYLQMELEEMIKKQTKQPKDWGWVGTSGYVREELIKIVSQVSNIPANLVEKTLGEE